MGRIGRVLSWAAHAISGYVKYDAGGREILQGTFFTDAGVDAPPLNGDKCLSVAIRGAGRTATVGCVDTKNPSVAQQGEHRTYSRSVDGVIVATVHLKGDGTISVVNDGLSFELLADGTATLTNGAGSFEMQSSGEFLINSARITTAGDFVTATGVSLNNHPHNQGTDSGGNTEQPTAPPTPTE